jgi:O-phospho-L-seryl-tRNASec:L-selenocysteinyl-tRNA synthase
MDSHKLQQLLTSSFAIPSNHITLGITNLVHQSKVLSILIQHKKIPNEPLSDLAIQSILLTLSALDTNREFTLNHTHLTSLTERWVGVGEREGRIYSSLVSSRNFGLGHGMGRSGDIMEPQPKAVGSSIMVQLTKYMVLDCMRRGAGLKGDLEDGKCPARFGLVLPLCTGMSMALVLSSLNKNKTRARTRMQSDESDDSRQKNVVLWSRIDQKTCYKAVLSAGFQCVVVPTKVEGDMVVTDLDAIKRNLDKYKNRVLAVISTTSCFAPRVPDQIDEIGKLCQAENVAHVINNAYGLQCQTIAKLINRACVVGRVDAIVCSTDKNFLVPVGGAIVISPRESVIQTVGQVYAGRASLAPILDLFITLLSMGLSGYKKLLQDRRMLMKDFEARMQQVATMYGERLLSCCPKNTISYGITLDRLSQPSYTYNSGEDADDDVDHDHDTMKMNKDATADAMKTTSLFGSMLFTRCVSGTRVVAKGSTKVIQGQEFRGFGSSTDDYPYSYLTAACAIGLTRDEMNDFFTRLEKCFKDFWARREKELKKKKKNKNRVVAVVETNKESS